MADTTRESQPAIPNQPQTQLGQCTTTELATYEAELQRTLRMSLDADARTLVLAKLDAVTREHEARERIAARGVTWPMH